MNILIFFNKNCLNSEIMNGDRNYIKTLFSEAKFIFLNHFFLNSMLFKFLIIP